jgi:F-type H+-transporting ATPase subunit delta
VKNNLVARRYAKAVLKNLDGKDHLSFREDINSLKTVFTKDKEFIKSLNSFLYPLNERLELADEIAAELGTPGIWKNLFFILIKKHRFNIIYEILTGLENHILAEEGRVKATLTLAFQHDRKMISRVMQQVEKELGSKIEEKIIIDPSIIGGFVAETETMRIDGSIHNNLVRLVQTSLKDSK